MTRSLEWYRDALHNLGAAFLVKRELQKHFRSSAPLNQLSAKALNHPVYARPHTTDYWVFDDIFVSRMYGCLDSIAHPKLILDCGANVGFASAYFLSKFPSSFVIAVEPDIENFAVLEKNLLPYRARCKAIRAAVWSRAEALEFDKEYSGRGQEWARRVQRSTSNAGPFLVPTITIPELIAIGDCPRVSLLKLDIEGAETELFRSASDWLDKIDNIAVELHGEEATDCFYHAIAPHDFHVTKVPGVTFCFRNG